MSKTVGVLGCGWLGLPLAVALLDKGFQVKGTTTSESKLPQLEKVGIEACQINLKSSQILGPVETFLNGLDILIINVPPGLRNNTESTYIGKMIQLHRMVVAGNVNKIIFVSSTSVYGKAEGELTEDSPVNPSTESGKQLVQSEKLFMDDPSLNTTVVRFGGLIGPGRHPVYRLAGKKGLSNGDDAVNLIHLNDCIHLICTIVDNDWYNQVFNGVNPEHPSKAEYYSAEAIKLDLPPPVYQGVTGELKGKIVISRNFLIKNDHFYTSIHS